MKRDDVVLYGISTCDTVRKARRWLDAHAVNYLYHDLRKDGLTRTHIERWSRLVGWEELLNRSSRTFKALPPEASRNLDASHALQLMLDHPTLVRRPICEHGARLLIGFKPERYAAHFVTEMAF